MNDSVLVNNSVLLSDSLAARIREYSNTAAQNDWLHSEFTRLTDTIPYLKKHRDFVEQNRWGFGDRAFHYMWLLVLIDVAEKFEHVKALEIGVYKGQVISLWGLIAKELKLELSITAISPFEGNERPMSGLRKRLRGLLDSNYRKAVENGNLYEASDYMADVRQVFVLFGLSDLAPRLIKGYSTDPQIAKGVGDDRFSIIYIDGDHSYEAVRSDILNYAFLLEDNGYLVMDDASFFLPGDGFFKGHKSVSLACEELPSHGFLNVLNVGHNRVYKRVVESAIK